MRIRLRKVKQLLGSLLLGVLLVQQTTAQTQIGAAILGEAIGDQLGYSVSYNATGDIMAIGAPDNAGNGANSGAVRIYQNISGTWEQLGATLLGEAAGDKFGTSVSLDFSGDLVAIGAPGNDGNDGNGVDSGHVRVYQNINGTWTQVGVDIDGEAAGDLSGTSVSLHWDNLNTQNILDTKLSMAIGAPGNDGNDGNKVDSGHVRFYKYISGTWTQQGGDIDGEAAGDLSGTSVSLMIANLPIVFIGAPGNDGNGVDSGHVRSYVLQGGAWEQLGGDIDGEAAGDQSGWSVNTLFYQNFSQEKFNVAIGAPKNDDGGVDSGHVRIYKFIPVPDTWTQIGGDIDGAAAGDQSGWSVSFNVTNNMVAIGAPNNAGNGVDSGHVRIYQNISETWTLHKEIAGSGVDEHFGTSVSLDFTGDKIVVGGPGSSNGTGTVSAYQLVQSLTATPQIGGNIEGKEMGDRLGTSVSYNAAGTIMAIGATGSGLTHSGYVQIYQNTGGTWTQIGNDIEGEAVGDQSGASISLNAAGDIVAIGAPGNDESGVDVGHVRIYQNISGSWTQIGNDIDGETAGDFSGWSISLNAAGDIVAIGTPDNDDNGTNSGHVRVFQNISGTWTQIGSDIDGEAVHDSSGTSISLNATGDVVAIGALGNNGNGSNSGHVRIYQNISGTWTQIGNDIDGETAHDTSGSSVSLNAVGDIVAIGSVINTGNVGHVRIYQNTGGTWTQIGSDIDGETAGDQSGSSISLNAVGDVVAIGAINNLGNGFDSGHVRIYRNIAGTWTLGYEIDGSTTNERFGTSVSLNAQGDKIIVGALSSANNTGTVSAYQLGEASTQIGVDINGADINNGAGTNVSYNAAGDIMAIGAPNNDSNGSNSGQVRVYQNIVGTWTQLGGAINGESAENLSGSSVSLNAVGDIVAIGAPQNNSDGTATHSGHVRVYQNIAGVWTQLGGDINGESAGDFSGSGVSLNAVGDIVAIGAPKNSSDGTAIDSGHVRIYQNIAGTWTQLGSDINGAVAFDQSGVSVSLNTAGDIVAIGAATNDSGGSNSGHVRIYQNTGSIWTQLGNAINGEAGLDQSGFSMSLNAAGDVVAIGATENDDNGSNSGHVRVYSYIEGVWTQIGGDIDGEAVQDQSGWSVSLNAAGDVVAIGAPNNDATGSNSGHVRIYRNMDGTWTLLREIDGSEIDENLGVSVSLNAKGDKIVVGGSGASGVVRAYQLGVFFKGNAFLSGAFRGDAKTVGAMSANLNVDNRLPLISPYGDGATLDATLLGKATMGATTNVGRALFWVQVELRDKNNIATIIERKSMLMDGRGELYDPAKFSNGFLTTNNLCFLLPNDDYHVVISHRNHLGIATKTPIALTSDVNTANVFNLTKGFNVRGGNAQMLHDSVTGNYSLNPGDVDSNGQVQISDFNAGLSDLGQSGYYNADVNLDGQVQISELIDFLFPYFGVGIQY